MKLIKGDSSLIITLNLLYLLCFIYSGSLEFLYLLIFNIVILIIQIAYRNSKNKQITIELTKDINKDNEILEEYLEEKQDSSILEKEYEREIKEAKNEEEYEVDTEEYDEDQFDEYEDSDIEEELEESETDNQKQECYEKISENNIKVDSNKNYTAIIIFIILAAIVFLIITFKNIDIDEIEPINNKKEDKLNDIIGEWDTILKIENGFYISTIFIYGNNLCGGMSAITSDAGVQVLGSYTCDCYMKGNKLIISDSGATYYYNEQDNLLESYDTGAIYTKISTDPCTNIYASCN